MIGKKISHYKIIEKLGEGGMGVVYKAEDTKLKRTVALKFLTAQAFGSDEEKSRFNREAQAAAALNHPHIATIYEIDEVDGQLFITMEYIDGQSLKEKIDKGPLKVEEVVRIAIDTADGLQAAHEKGIVHRDIKPANIMLTEKNQVKITDFGLAKLVGQTKLTRTGMTLGTMAYMSPEQTEGQEVDHRSDIFSFGVVLYEMLTGQHPFKGDYEQAVMYSILHEEPEPITGLRTGVPMELERIVFKVLEKNPEERYQHADEILTDLRRVQKTPGTKAEQYVSEARKPRLHRWLASPILWTLAIVLVGLAGGVLLFYPTETIPFSERDWILITDFENLTDVDVFSGTLKEALTIDMQQSSYVNVFSGNRIAETLKRMGNDTVSQIDESIGREICMREGIHAMLVGNISKIGKNYSIIANVVNTATGDAVISEKVLAKGKESVLDALDNLSSRIRKNLGESLAAIAEQDKPLAKVTTPSLQALRYFSIGQELVRKAEWHEAIPFYERAVHEDSSFAVAYATLGQLHQNMGRSAEALKYSALAMKWIDRVTDREKHTITAAYHNHRGDLQKSIENYKVLVRLYPDSFTGHNNLVFTYQFTRQYSEALEHLQELQRLTPNTWYVHHNMGLNYGGLGEVDKAIENFEKALEISPKQYWSNVGLGLAYLIGGDVQETQKQFEFLLENGEEWQSIGEGWLVGLYLYLGKFNEALSHALSGIIIDQRLGKQHSEALKHIIAADIYQRRDDKKNYLQRLQQAVAVWPSAWILAICGREYARNRMFAKANGILHRLEVLANKHKTKSNIAQVYKLKGELGFSKSNYAEALTHFQSSNSYEDNLETRESLARTYFKIGDYDKARKEYEYIIQHQWATLFDAGPTLWALSHYRLGEIYESKGDTIKAIKYYKNFLNIFKQADEDLQEVIDAKTRMAELKRMSLK